MAYITQTLENMKFKQNDTISLSLNIKITSALTCSPFLRFSAGVRALPEAGAPLNPILPPLTPSLPPLAGPYLY